MASVALSRFGSLSNTATTYVCLAATNKLKPKPMIPLPEDDHHHHDDHHMSLPNSFTPLSSSSLSKTLIGGKLRVSSAFSRSASVRYAHTDVKVPDFTEYRTELTENPNASSKNTIDERQTFHYISTFGIGLLTAYGAKAIVRDLVQYISPAADVLALAKVEVNLNEIPVGKNVTVKWRSKPLFVRHRTPEEIESEKQVDLSSLRDPQADDARCKNPEFLVVLGICTHLGCVPLANAGDFNGYFCPCHGSHYDSSGRIRKGPAPLNLEVPPYTIDGDLLVVG